MNILALIKPAFTVLKHGKSLTKAETWKNAQAITNLMIAVAAIVTAFVPRLEIPPDMISNIAIAIAGAANWYFTLATSEKVGLPPIDLQAKPEIDADELFRQKFIYPTQERKLREYMNENPNDVIAKEMYEKFIRDSRAIPAYIPTDDPRGLRKHPVSSRTESEFESDESHGFNDK